MSTRYAHPAVVPMHLHCIAVERVQCACAAEVARVAMARTLRSVADMALRQNIGRLVAAMVASTCGPVEGCRCRDAGADAGTDAGRRTACSAVSLEIIGGPSSVCFNYESLVVTSECDRKSHTQRQGIASQKNPALSRLFSFTHYFILTTKLYGVLSLFISTLNPRP